MTDLAPDLIAHWRINYGLDKRTPEEAMRWWSDNNIGQAPAGAVAALGLCLEEIARLTDEREFHRRHVVEMKDVLRRGGWVECDIPACNCGSWHHRYGLPERWREICDALIRADVLDNSTGNLPLRAIQRLTYERDEWRDADRAECERIVTYERLLRRARTTALGLLEVCRDASAHLPAHAPVDLAAARIATDDLLVWLAAIDAAMARTP